MSLDALWKGALYSYAESASAGADAVITIAAVSGRQICVGMVKCTTEVSGNVTLTIHTNTTSGTKLWKELILNTGSTAGSPQPIYFHFAMRGTVSKNLVVTANPVGSYKAEVCLVHAFRTTA